MAAGGPYQRHAARVLLVDGAGRILLFRCYQDGARPDLGHFWITPGGGIRDGEPVPAAAARELAEETGLVVPPAGLGRCVAVASGYATVDGAGAGGVFREDFFYHRLDGHHEVDTSGFEEIERSLHGGHRWWTLDELSSTTETVYPLGLARLFAGLLAGRVPPEPVRLRWTP